jgi:toxin ParE1/3/4
MEVEWSRAALDDLGAIRAFIARDKPSAAGEVTRVIREAGEGLRTLPSRGRPGRWYGTRELVTRFGYVVPYRVKGRTIEILRVFHDTQAWPREAA